MDTSILKQLREETGFGVMDIKRALEEAEGDVAKARELLKAKSAMVVAKKADRETRHGILESYNHLGKVVALVEVNCETDFVARNDNFKQFAHDLALHVASMNPKDYDELIEQPFFKDESVTVRQVLDQLVGKIGENIKVSRFARYALNKD